MLSNATWITWKSQQQRKVRQHRRKRRQAEVDAAQTANVIKEKRNENQSDQRTRGRPGEGPALLYGGARVQKEDGLFARAISLADGGLARGAGRHGVATGAEQQPGSQSVSAGAVSTEPARGHVLFRRRAGRIRANQRARRGIHDATHGCDSLEDRHAQGHLRQPHSGDATETLVERSVSG